VLIVTHSVLTTCATWYIYLEPIGAINPLRQRFMQIFSKGNLYIGKDDESYTDIQIHFGRFVLEWTRSPKSDGTRTTTEESN
jgi:hypothetical protein